MPCTRTGLKKKSPKTTAAKKAIDTWQRRYFVLSGGTLSYFKTEKAAHMSNSESLKAISLEQVLFATVNPRLPESFVIDLGQERKVKLQAASEAECAAWVSAIEAAKLKHGSSAQATENLAASNVMGGTGGGSSARAAASGGGGLAGARSVDTPPPAGRDAGTELAGGSKGVRGGSPAGVDAELTDIRLLRSGGRGFDGGAQAGCCVVS